MRRVVCCLKMLLVLSAAALGACGCGPRPVTGGTPGVLRVGGWEMAEVQVTLHRRADSTWQAIGFADTTTDGSFELVTLGATGPLRLKAGEYRVTLESVGAPIQIPPAYRQPASSPLQVSWSAGDHALNLELTGSTCN